jgi:alkyl sulfatase BDS1-like metallo-beta-lactamase superfamily hydrolase
MDKTCPSYAGILQGAPLQQAGVDVVRTMTLDTFFGVLAVRLNGQKLEITSALSGPSP